MTSAQERFIRSRIHWGAHLPTDILDGLMKLEKQLIDPPPKPDLNKLFDSLLTLETRRTVDGRHLYEEIPEDQQKIVWHLSTVRSIVYSICGWE